MNNKCKMCGDKLTGEQTSFCKPCGFVKFMPQSAGIEQLIEVQQRIQMNNPPASDAWLSASKEMKQLITKLIGKAPKDVQGKR